MRFLCVPSSYQHWRRLGYYEPGWGAAEPDGIKECEFEVERIVQAGYNLDTRNANGKQNLAQLPPRQLV